MSGMLSGFVRSMRQKCEWLKYAGEDDGGNPTWNSGVEIPCIFKPSREIADGATGAVLLMPSQFYVDFKHPVLERDKIIFRDRVYVVESVADLDFFGGLREGFKCSCRQEGGVAV